MKSSNCIKKLLRIRKIAERMQGDLLTAQRALIRARDQETITGMRHEIRRALDLLSVYEKERR